MAKVLVIDDDPKVRRVVTRFIELEGHTVVEAENGREALARFEGDPADLVISDIYMPEMDGIELLMQLRARFPEAKLVAMSGGGAIAATHVLKAARALGAVAILEKPFELEAIRELLSDVEGEEAEATS
jgi:CheY-like chemotaxis protein